MDLPGLVILQKPTYGEPCNRCGICCERELCHTAMEEHRPNHRHRYPSEEWKGPCPSLIYNRDGTTTCGLWERVSKWISLGGCFCPDQTKGWQNIGGKNEARARAKVNREMAKVVRESEEPIPIPL